MRKVYIFVLSTLFTVITTAEVMAGGFLKAIGFGNGPENTVGGNVGGGDVVGAPLDGGLLAILAAAGVTYFVARRKKKNKE